MASLDSIAADQQAVLQMILRRGLGYEEIAALLGIDRAAVRQRALDGFDALAAPGAVPALQRALITDYLLGQLPPRVAEDVYDRLANSRPDRDWAMAVSDALEGIDGELAPLPDDQEQLREAPAQPEQLRDDELVTSAPPDHPEEPAVSRRGGALLLAAIPAIVLVVAVVVVALTVGGGHKKPIPARFQTKTTSAPARTTSTPSTASRPATTSTPATSTAGSSVKLLAALNLSSPTGAKGAVGVVQVIREAGLTGIVVKAQGVPANGAHNAYAIWLRNRQTGASSFLGFLQAKVGKSGKFATDGQLPTGATRYNQILVTIETERKPAAPGEVILSGPFRESP